MSLPYLEYESPDGEVLVLTSAPAILRDLEGAGLPDPIHHTVRTPSRDGEFYVGSLLDVRFVRAHLAIVPEGDDEDEAWAAYTAWMRLAARTLHPRRRTLQTGTLRLRPHDGAPTYEIDAVYAGGLGGGGVKGAGFNERTVVSFRCPDPAWRELPISQVTLDLEAAGWVIPWTIPWEIAASGAVANVSNSGGLQSFPVIVFVAGETGAEDPAFTNQTTGRTFRLAGLSMDAGEILVVDMGARTAELEGVSVIGQQDSSSRLWPLEPGLNQIAVSLGSGGGTTTLQWWRRVAGVF